MKAKYLGTGCGRIRKNVIYDIEVDHDSCKVTVVGDTYRYMFKYKNMDILKENWDFRERGSE